MQAASTTHIANTIANMATTSMSIKAMGAIIMVATRMARGMDMRAAMATARMAATAAAGAGQVGAGKGGASGCSAQPNCRWCCCT